MSLSGGVGRGGAPLVPNEMGGGTTRVEGGRALAAPADSGTCVLRDVTEVQALD